MARPSIRQLKLAAGWLEDCGPEASAAVLNAVLVVAGWLRDEVDRREFERKLRQVAREQGVGVAAVRAAIALAEKGSK